MYKLLVGTLKAERSALGTIINFGRFDCTRKPNARQAPTYWFLHYFGTQGGEHLNKEPNQRAIRIYQKYAELRDKKGLTDYQVAKDCGFSRSLFYDWKNGHFQPKLEKLETLARYFKVSVNHFIKE